MRDRVSCGLVCPPVNEGSLNLNSRNSRVNGRVGREAVGVMAASRCAAGSMSDRQSEERPGTAPLDTFPYKSHVVGYGRDWRRHSKK